MILEQSKDIVFAVSRRQENMSLDYGNTSGSLDNRRKFLDKISIDYKSLVCAKQVHCANVACVEEKDKGRGALSSENALPDTDAFITNTRNIPLAIFTADCLSIFLYDLSVRCIGVVHAGWRSSKDNIVSKTIGLMREKLNASPRNLCAFLGPAIRDCCYEVGGEFNNYFDIGVVKRGSRYYLDLIAINKRQLIDSGVSQDNISDCERCTSCYNKEYFSYRREKESCGRMMSVIMLR